MGVVDRRRHEGGRLVAGVAEHDALVARAFFLVVAGLVGVDALGDVGRLRMQQDVDLRRVPVEAVLLIADVAHRHASDVGDEILGYARRAASFARDDDAVGGGERFAGGADRPRIDSSLLTLAEEQIDDLVGDAVADLVGMAFRDRLAGELVILPDHRSFLSGLLSPRPDSRVARRQKRAASDRRRSVGQANCGGIVRFIERVAPSPSSPKATSPGQGRACALSGRESGQRRD